MCFSFYPIVSKFILLGNMVVSMPDMGASASWFLVSAIDTLKTFSAPVGSL